MFKKFVSLAVGTACLFSMVGVSATMTVTTSTAYQASDIKVTTTVAGTEEEMNGTTLTYLAHDAEGITDGSNIVYVDQIIANDTSKKFEYVTQYSKIGSTVKVGGRTSAGTAIAPTLESEITGVPVYIGENENPVTATFTTAGAEAGLVKIESDDFATVNITGLTGVESTDYFIGTNCIWVKNSVLNDNTELYVSTDSASVAGQTVSLGYKVNNPEGEGNSAIAVGYVVGNVQQYGIIYSADATIESSAIKVYGEDTEAGDYAFPALGKGTNGLYAVEVFNLEDDFTGALGDKVYAAAYYIDEEGYHIGKVFEVATAGGSGEAVTALASVDEVEEVVEEEAIIFDVVEEDEIEFIEIEDVIEIEEIEEIEEVDEVDEIDIVE